MCRWDEGEKGVLYQEGVTEMWLGKLGLRGLRVSAKVYDIIMVPRTLAQAR